MTLLERVTYFENLFDTLQMTMSRNEKLDIVNSIPDELKDDFTYIVECLEGMHPFGFKMENYYGTLIGELPEFTSIKNILKWLQTPKNQEDLSRDNINSFVIRVPDYAYDFIQQIVDREYKLGIGKSLLEKKVTSPMLAKKFEGTLLSDRNGYYITEKLDGNRCIASYDIVRRKWIFTSRNGKEMKVDFDMGDLPKTMIFDGEVLSPEQVEMSNYITMAVRSDKGYFKRTFNSEFNKTSGLINQKNNDKKLIYNIFDIVNSEFGYSLRRVMLDNSKPFDSTNYISKNVRILPVLKHFEIFDYNTIVELLNKVTDIGGEGIMINYGSRKYEQKRTDSLLKFKKVQSMDMKVVDIEYSETGKYAGQVGSIICEINTANGLITCKVGTGLSDEQRLQWRIKPTDILGKIVEVQYFSISVNKNDNKLSLRFPRLKQIRFDKTDTSEY